MRPRSLNHTPYNYLRKFKQKKKHTTMPNRIKVK